MIYNEGIGALATFIDYDFLADILVDLDDYIEYLAVKNEEPIRYLSYPPMLSSMLAMYASRSPKQKLASTITQ